MVAKICHGFDRALKSTYSQLVDVANASDNSKGPPKDGHWKLAKAINAMMLGCWIVVQPT